MFCCKRLYPQVCTYTYIYTYYAYIWTYITYITSPMLFIIEILSQSMIMNIIDQLTHFYSKWSWGISEKHFILTSHIQSALIYNPMIGSSNGYKTCSIEQSISKSINARKVYFCYWSSQFLLSNVVVLQSIPCSTNYQHVETETQWPSCCRR